MKILVVLLLVVLLVAVWRLTSLSAVVARQQQTLTQQQQKIAGLTAARSSRQNDFAMQGRCAAQAEKVFRDLGYELNGSTTNASEVHQSHFNPKLNNCFMTLETFAGAPSPFL